MMKHMNRSTNTIVTGLAVLLVVFVAAAAAVRADVDFAALPAVVDVQPGDVFDIELTVTEAGDAFNGYDAIVGFDPAAVTFIELSQAEQEGPLMTDTCSNNFHIFEILPGGDTLSLSHIMLCSGLDTSGPGVVYRLRFQAGTEDVITSIDLLPGTAFYLAGLNLTPVNTANAQVRIGQVSSVPSGRLAADVNLLAAPNPFNPMTTISFEAPAAERARVRVFSSRGHLVADLLDEHVAAGRNSVVWNGRDRNGQTVGSGNYMVRLELGGEPFIRWITLLK